MSSFTLSHGSYVKFVRTTSAVWSQVSDQEKNTDTLYFVLKPETKTGDLYLGPTLIAGVDAGSTLAELKDVLHYTDDDVAHGSLLMWNKDHGQWEPTQLFEILQSMTEQITLMVMSGSTGVSNGYRGLVPDQPAGTQNWYLSGSGKWVNPIPTIQATAKTTIYEIASGWFGDDWSNLTQTPHNDITIRGIATSEVDKVVAQAPAKFDTLKKIADWIAQQPTNLEINNIINRVNAIETRIFTDVPANPLTGAPAQISIITQIGDLNTSLVNVKNDIITIKDTLKWQSVE